VKISTLLQENILDLKQQYISVYYPQRIIDEGKKHILI